jgi:Tol biopolymer transport system component
MRYVKLLATLAGAGAIASALAITAQGTAPGKNGRILFQGNVGNGTQLFTIRPDGSGLARVTHVRANQGFEDGAWSNDGTMIAYSHDLRTHGRGEIARPDGSHPHAITPRRFQFAGDPDWLPDGRRLVVGALRSDPASHRKCDAGLRLVTATGRLIRTITHQTGRRCMQEHWDVNADVSPDGTRIAFDASSPDGDAICVVGLNGHGRKCLTDRADDAAHPVWSPDGTKILFQTHHDPDRNHTGATANLFSIRPDGSDLTQITHLSGDGFYSGMGSWSPDGTQIVYHKVAPNDVDDLFLIDIDGSNERQLTHLGPDVHPGGVDWGTNQG